MAISFKWATHPPYMVYLHFVIWSTCTSFISAVVDAEVIVYLRFRFLVTACGRVCPDSFVGVPSSGSVKLDDAVVYSCAYKLAILDQHQWVRHAVNVDPSMLVFEVCGASAQLRRVCRCPMPDFDYRKVATGST